MKARYQYRIYPTQRQAQKLAQLFGCCRVVWNDALARVKSTPLGDKWPSNSGLQKQVITQAKKTPERHWLSDVSSVPLQQSVRDLGVAFSNFFKSRSGKRKGKRVGFPRFKKRSSRQSARFVKTGFSLKGNKLELAKLGRFKVKWSRPLPSTPSSVTITKNTAGQYHASFVVEIDSIDIEPIHPSVGVDLGIRTFAHLSTGEKIESPDYSKITRKIRRMQRKLSRQIKGSNRRHQTRLKLAKLHLKLASTRKDFLHKITTRLIHENQVVCREDLNVSGMVKNQKLARVISEQGWGNFRTFCEAKAQLINDREVKVISRWEPTSQTCSDCGYKWGKIDLSIRSVVCLNCGTEQDRDENAAKNIEKVGVGHTHDSKWTKNGHKTRVSGNPIALSNQPSVE
ncbi:transposase [Phormidium willei BDU 130791]|nr:transposase [Phormidium willei BDU 130791]